MEKKKINWEEEEKKLQEEYKRKLEVLRKKKQESEMMSKVFTKGMLPILVMSMVYQEPCNGNEISTKIAELTGGLWQPSTGGIYPILKKMEKQGFMVSSWDDPDKKLKRIYKITEEGKEEFHIQNKMMKESVEDTVYVMQCILKHLG